MEENRFEHYTPLLDDLVKTCIEYCEKGKIFDLGLITVGCALVGHLLYSFYNGDAAKAKGMLHGAAVQAIEKSINELREKEINKN